MSEYPLVIKKVSGEPTAAHEAMHVATLIYYIIKYYDKNRLELLNDILSWSLNEVTIVENELEQSKGCFTHRAWHGYTDKADIYCSFSGFIGGYIFTKAKEYPKRTWQENLSTLRWWYASEYITPDGLESDYAGWGADGDLQKTGVIDYETRLKYIREIMKLLNKSKPYQELFLECKEMLQQKYTLYKEDLMELANKYRERILLETRNNRITCVSLGKERPEYTYYAI